MKEKKIMSLNALDANLENHHHHTQVKYVFPVRTSVTVVFSLSNTLCPYIYIGLNVACVLL